MTCPHSVNLEDLCDICDKDIILRDKIIEDRDKTILELRARVAELEKKLMEKG